MVGIYPYNVVKNRKGVRKWLPSASGVCVDVGENAAAIALL